MPGALEYEEEEDLFGSAEEDIPLQQFNSARPIAGPSRLPSPPPAAPRRIDHRLQSPPIAPVRARPPPAPCPPENLPLLKPSVGLARVRPRLLELKELKEVKPPAAPKVGPMSLKAQCMAVVKANAIRTWDIGDVEYSLIKEFIDDLPAEQLAAIEEASPHIRKDTDWLWEYFLLTDFAAAHEKYAEKNGERRTSGWRRTYKKAAIEARERQQNAAERVAERYKEMDKERAEKRIVVLNQVMQPQKPRRIAGGMFGAQRPLTVTAKSNTLLGKAKADFQRTRIAMTHASGKFVPPPSRYPSTSSSSSSRPIPIPTLGGRPAPKAIDGPRIPGPRRAPAPTPAPTTINGSPEFEIIPGAMPTSEYLAKRSALPAHLAALPSPATKSTEPARFSTERKRKFSTIRPAAVPNFKPPDPKTSAPARADFFGTGGSEGAKRQRVAEENGSGPKQSTPQSSPSGASIGEARSAPAMRSGSGPEQTQYSPGRISEEAAAKLKGVLFRSKPKSRAAGR